MELYESESGCRLVLGDRIRLPAMADLHSIALRAAERGGDVEVDLERSEHLHAAALQIVVALHASVVARGRQLRIINMSEPARDALSLAGLRALLGETST